MIFPWVFLMCFHRIYPTLKLMIFWPWLHLGPAYPLQTELWFSGQIRASQALPGYNFSKTSQSLCKELLCAFTHSWPVVLYAPPVPADAPVVVRSQVIPHLPFAYESCFHQTKRKVIFTPSYTFFPADHLYNSVSWSCRPRYFSQKFIHLAGARWSTPI